MVVSTLIINSASAVSAYIKSIALLISCARVPNFRNEPRGGLDDEFWRENSCEACFFLLLHEKSEQNHYIYTIILLMIVLLHFHILIFHVHQTNVLRTLCFIIWIGCTCTSKSNHFFLLHTLTSKIWIDAHLMNILQNGMHMTSQFI